MTPTDSRGHRPLTHLAATSIVENFLYRRLIPMPEIGTVEIMNKFRNKM